VIFVFLPLAFAGRWLFGLHGLFAASTIANIAVGLLAFVWLRKHVNTSAKLPPIPIREQ
jgi:Na+-driven multidrug efflux pump